MKSPEKVLLFLEELQGFSDDDIAEAIPVPMPPPALRMMLAGVATALGEDAEALDANLTQLGNFCLNLRSDEVLDATAG